MLVNMDDMAGPQRNHSTVLFVDESGSPMHFYMAPCQEKSTLRPLIEHGGGVISSKVNNESIKLAPEGMLVKSDDYIHQQFIIDCVGENKLLGMKHYRVASGSVITSPSKSLTDLEPSHIIIQAAHDKKGRKKYLLAQDTAILRYLLEDGRYNGISGNMVWRDMEMLEVTQHTWQSMKDHYKKQILPNITSYKLEKKDIAKLTGNLNSPPPQQGTQASKLVMCLNPLVVSNKSTKNTEDAMPNDEDLDDFDQELFAHASGNPRAPGGTAGTVLTKGKRVPTNTNNDVPKSKKNKPASTQNADSNIVVLHRTLDNVFDVEARGDYVTKRRRRRPLKFRTINSEDKPCNGNGISEKIVTSKTAEARSDDADITVPSTMVSVNQSPVRGHCRDICDTVSPQKRHTRTLRSRNDELENVIADMSPEPSPQKKRKKAKGKTRGIPDDVENGQVNGETREMIKTLSDAQKDGNKDVATEAALSWTQTRAASRQVERSQPEDEEDDNNEKCIDPCSYLRRGQTKARPAKDIQTVVSYVMLSSEESEAEDKQTAPYTNSDDGDKPEEKKKKKRKKTQNKDKISDEIKMFDTVVQWLGIPPQDFLDKVLSYDGSVDDAIVSILTGRT